MAQVQPISRRSVEMRSNKIKSLCSIIYFHFLFQKSVWTFECEGGEADCLGFLVISGQSEPDPYEIYFYTSAIHGGLDMTFGPLSIFARVRETNT